jgi:4-hydroxy-tetrahydrodipicolinate reductase
MTRIGIAGIGGRMGREVLAVAQTEANMAVTSGLVRAGSRSAVASTLGTSTPLHEDPAELLADVDVVIDFTNPNCSVSLARECAAEGRPLVCGTTGLSAAQLAELQELSNRTAIVYSRNMSVGIAALLASISELVRALDGFDIEIIEMHHRHKADAPSGTALAIAETVASSLDRIENDSLVFGRHGVSPRQQHHIGIHAVRGGGNAGEHIVVLAGEGEELRVSHRAYGRRTFALGALRAARFVAEQPPGFYAMRDVLGMGR